MKFLKRFEHYDMPGMKEYTPKELEASVKNPGKINVNTFTNNTVDAEFYEKMLKKRILTIIPELKNLDFTSHNFEDTTSIYFTMSKEQEDNFDTSNKKFDLTFEITLYHKTNKLRMSLECGITSDYDEDDQYDLHGHKKDMEEDIHALQDLFFYKNNIYIKDLEHYLEEAAVKIYQYTDYCLEKYNFNPLENNLA